MLLRILKHIFILILAVHEINCNWFSKVPVTSNATEIDTFPSIVSILTRKDGPFVREETWTHYCGGTIITKFKVLTSGSCVEKLMTKEYHKKDVLIRGNTEMWDCACGRTRDHNVAGFIRHPKYRALTMPFAVSLFENDIGIITVQEEFRGIYEEVHPYKNSWSDTLFIYGWGFYDEKEKKIPKQLRSSETKVYNRGLCQKVYRNKIPEGSFCVWSGNDTINTEPCAYDTGGPILNVESKIIGIVSSGYGCKQQPGICTLLTKYHQWIDANLKKDTNPNSWF